MTHEVKLTYSEIDGVSHPDLSISNPSTPQEIALGKYGRMALNHLRNHHPHRFLALHMQGDLMKKIGEREQEALNKMETLNEQLLKLHPLPQTNDPLERARHLNQLKETAEELILKDILFRPI